MAWPVVTRDLAFRFETAEADYNEDRLRGLREDASNRRGVDIIRIGRTILFSIQSRRQNPSLNRVMRFAVEDIQQLSTCVKWVRDRADSIWFDVTPPLVDEHMMDQLVQLQLYPTRFANTVYMQPMHHDYQPAPGITIDTIDLANLQDMQTYAQVLALGFGIPESLLESTIKSSQLEYSSSSWRLLLCRMDAYPAAVAALHTKSNLSSIYATATAPNYRRRGCQSALLHACVNLAAYMGSQFLLSQCDPGSVSQNNMLRAGFRIAYTKLIYSNKTLGG